jgi:hypothetical protein
VSQLPFWILSWRFFKKLKTDLPYDPVIPFLGIHSKECKSGYNRDTCTPIFISPLFTIAKLYPTTDEWIKKL